MRIAERSTEAAAESSRPILKERKNKQVRGKMKERKRRKWKRTEKRGTERKAIEGEGAGEKVR